MNRIKENFNFINFFAFVIFASIYVYFYMNHDSTINETYKNILLLIAGFVFGSSKNSQKKDDTISAMQQEKNSVQADTVNAENVENVTATTVNTNEKV
jgi:hypothetical protein